MKYAVYQRRLVLEAMKNKAMLLAMLDNKEGSAETAKLYLEMAIPMSKMLREAKETAVQRQMAEIEQMVPQQAHAVRVEDVMAAEAKRQGHVPRAPVQQLTGAALAAHLNAQEQAKGQKPVAPIGGRRAPMSPHAPQAPGISFSEAPAPRPRKPG